MENEKIDINNFIRSLSVVLSVLMITIAVSYIPKQDVSASVVKSYDNHGHEITSQQPVSRGASAGCGV